MSEKPGKAPQDHKPKAEKPEVIEIEMPDGVDDDGKPKTRKIPGKRVVVNGVTVDVADEALDDFELLDDLRAVQDSQDASRMPSVLRRLIGDQYKPVIESLRGENGRVSIEAGSKFLTDLFGALNPNL